jgi:hypothetical protein
MTVISFPRARAATDPAAFTMGARHDLRLAAPACAVIRPLGPEGLAYSGLARILRAARIAWRARHALAQLSIVLPEPMLDALDAETLEAAAIEAGCTKKSLTFEFEETWVVAHGVATPEALRARGWGIALRGDDACPLPFGARARGLYDELVLAAPDDVHPFLALDMRERAPLGRRLLAAREAGMLLTAEGVTTHAQAKLLALAGFDRASGAYADSGRG